MGAYSKHSSSWAYSHEYAHTEHAIMKEFRQKVLAVVSKIPKGGTLTYKEVAKRAGNARASRAVGSIMKTNYDPEIPCHRVVRSDGKAGGYNRGAKNKIKILKVEGAKLFTTP